MAVSRPMIVGRHVVVGEGEIVRRGLAGHRQAVLPLLAPAIDGPGCITVASVEPAMGLLLNVLGNDRRFLTQAEFVLGFVPWDKRFIAIAADGGVKLSSVFQILHAFRQASKLTRKVLDGRDKFLLLAISHKHPSSA
jgi:hypothetical protein